MFTIHYATDTPAQGKQILEKETLELSHCIWTWDNLIQSCTRGNIHKIMEQLEAVRKKSAY